jgi:uroporphyrinogen III methyltransferase / synthase
MSTPVVYLVGAGPGDPGLITVKGLNLIRQADCIIYDGLANPLLLEQAGPQTELISVAKRSGRHSMKQDEINDLLVQKAAQYNTVVRLKGGDPCLFGRAAEEVEACINAGIRFEIVPGITSGIAAAEYAGIFLTNRRYASAVCFVTGRQAEGIDPSELDWQTLAAFSGTLVFYMGVENIESIAQTLIAKGKPADTPAAVIERATTPRQRLLRAALKDLPAQSQQQNIQAPAIIIIGQAAEQIPQADWFMQNPLLGKRVLITRDEAGNRVFAEKLAASGAEPLIFNAIEIEDLTQSLESELSGLTAFDWIIFTSANGVTHTLNRLHAMGLDARAFAGTKIACIGRPTADKLAQYGLKADFVPTRFTSEALADEMIASFDLQNRKILLLRSRIAPKEIVQVFTKAGAQVADVAVYDVKCKLQDAQFVEQVCAQIRAREIDYVSFTSSSTVDAFFSSVPKDLFAAGGPKIVSIGPAATKTLVAAGLSPSVEARVHTIDGIIEAIKG